MQGVTSVLEVVGLQTPVDQVDESQVGGKAINLMRMVGAGLHVPGGVVLPVAFFGPWFAQLQSSEHWRKLVSTTEFDAEDTGLEKAYASLHALASELELDTAQREALAEFRAGLVADERFCVRSSSPREDLQGSSFAGAYESVIGVNATTLEAAIRRVFASCFDVRVALYERSLGRSFAAPKIAVIIQRQIDSEKAGIGFSVHPLDNDYDRATFNANWGQGETVVSGLASPDFFVVDKHSLEICERTLGAKESSIWLEPDGGTRERRDPRHAELCLSDEELLALTREIIRVEQLYDRPMDIEWAFAEGQLYLLQARPITTHHPLAEELCTAPGEPRRLYLDVTMSVQGVLEPLSPMGISLFRTFFFLAGDEAVGLDEFPAPRDAALLPASNGRLYADLCNLFSLVGPAKVIVMLGEMDGLVRDAVEELDLEQFARGRLRRGPVIMGALARGHRRLPNVLRAFRRPELARDRWQQLWAEHQAELGAFVEAELPLMSLVHAVCGATVRLMLRETMVLFPLAKLALLKINGLFPEPDEQTSQWLAKLDQSLPGNVTVEMGHALYGLHTHLDGEAIADGASLQRAVDERTAPSEFLANWEAFLARYGHRGLREIDVGAPRYREQPALLLGQVAGFLAGVGTQVSPLELHAKAQREREAAAQALAARLGGRQRARFERWRKIIEALGGMRESHKFVLVHAVDTIRTRLLRHAGELVEAGRIDRAQDLFLLDLGQLERGLDQTQLDLRAPIEAARTRREGDAQCKQVFPLMDSRGRFHRPSPPEVGPGELGGRGVSAGCVRGVVKVLHTPDEKPLLPGEVLVTRATDPAWTPLFVNAAAIVLEIGGPLQHGALVAREYGKPCVCGIVGATERLHDGELVEVDGDTGIIRRIHAAPEPVDA